MLLFVFFIMLAYFYIDRLLLFCILFFLPVVILFRRLYFHGAQFHTQQFASMRKLTTLHCYNIAYIQHGGGNRW